MTKIIAANWKMNNGFDEANQWLANFVDFVLSNEDAIQDVDIVVCPPIFLIEYLDNEFFGSAFDVFEEDAIKENKTVDDFSADELFEMVTSNRPFFLGAQDCHYEKSGSFTGDVSAEMVKSLGADYVILGHSERRKNHFENDEIVAKKVAAAVEQSITPILCVGESKEIRDQGKHLEFVYKQLFFSIPKGVKFDRLIIAYEPIWSIGTGLIPTAAEISEMVKLIKKILVEKGANFAKEVFVIYGGSVDENNAKEIMAIEDVDGVLVGKASLDVDKFAKICVSS